MDARFDAGLVAAGALSFRGKRYFVNNLYRYSSRTWRFLFGDLMAEVYRATIDDEAYLFNEQWVVKGGERFNLAVSFLENGRNVYDHAADTPECWGGASPPGLAA